MADDVYGTIKKLTADDLAKFRTLRPKKDGPPAEATNQPAPRQTTAEAAQAREAALQARIAAALAPAPPDNAPMAVVPATRQAAGPAPKTMIPGAERLAVLAALAAKPLAAKPAERPKPQPAGPSARPLAEVIELCPLSDEAKPLLREGLTLLPYLHQLMGNKLYPDAIHLVAYAVPVREGISWACGCARSVAGTEPPAEVEAALQATEKWTAEPGEEKRRAALPAAEAAGFGTPAGCVALAAFCSGGSLSPAEFPPVLPPADVAPQTIANAVLLAGVTGEAEKTPDRYSQFLTEGTKLVAGLNPARDGGKSA
jgi:hypothetical protein